MTLTINARVAAELSVDILLDAATSPASSGQTPISLDQYSGNARLSSSSFPPIAAEPSDLSCTIPVGTTVDFDLTLAPKARDINETHDLTGKKPIAILLKAGASNNAAGITIGPKTGDNPYPLFVSTNALVLLPGEKLVRYLHHTSAITNNHTAVGPTAKNIRVSGAENDTLTCLILWG